MRDDVHEYLADHAELTIVERGEVLIFVGQLTVHAIAMERAPAHRRLAYVKTKNGSTMLLNVGAIYAVQEVESQAGIDSPP